MYSKFMCYFSYYINVEQTEGQLQIAIAQTRSLTIGVSGKFDKKKAKFLVHPLQGI